MGYSIKHAALVASTLLSLASVSQALGQAIVENHCSYPAYLWSVSNSQGPVHVLQPGQSYSETWQINPAGGGISIKIGKTDDISGPIVQYEYTLLGLLYYDLSRINGAPFTSEGISLVPSISTCQPIRCDTSGACLDGDVFYMPDDNYAIEACDSAANIVLTLCDGNAGATSGTQPPRKGHHHAHVPNPVVVPTPAPAASTPLPAAPTTSSSWPAPAPPAPPAPAPPAVTPPPYIPPGDAVVTTFQTFYTTVDATVDDIVTVTAK